MPITIWFEQTKVIKIFFHTFEVLGLLIRFLSLQSGIDLMTAYIEGRCYSTFPLFLRSTFFDLHGVSIVGRFRFLIRLVLIKSVLHKAHFCLLGKIITFFRENEPSGKGSRFNSI